MPFAPLLKLKEGCYRFVCLTSWDSGEDLVAAEKLKLMMNKDNLPEGIDRETFQSFYLTGERMGVNIGQVNSEGGAAALQKFSSMFSFGTNIEARFYHAVEAHELVRLFKEPRGGTGALRKKG